VIEIVQLIVDRAASLDDRLYRAFLAQNPRFARLTIERARSYWNCYHRYFGRAFKTFDKYPAYALFTRFGLAP
jgi:hypothetical protein